MGDKDRWNALSAADDGQFLKYVEHPELASLLPVLYPGVFPNLAGLKAARADLVAVLLTGIPAGIVPGFQNFTGKRYADQLRLNMAIPPASDPKPLGLIGGDAAGFPNGRRVFDDVVTVELRAIAGATYPLVNKTYTPDAAASLVTDGLGPNSTRYLSQFPVPRDASAAAMTPNRWQREGDGSDDNDDHRGHARSGRLRAMRLRARASRSTSAPKGARS